jgi:hypothetical protein
MEHIERGLWTHEYEDSARIFEPIFTYLLVFLLGLGNVHRPQLAGRIPIVFG